MLDAADANADLVGRIQRGDRDAEDEIVKYYRGKVYAIACARLRDHAAADDVSQECMLAVVRAIRAGEVRQPDRLSAFVYGVVRNLVSQHRRRWFWNRMSPLPDDSDFPAVSRGIAADQEKRRAVEALAEHMDPIDQQILKLTLNEGLGPGEIAQRLGISGDVVRARKSRAVKRLADALRGNSDE